MELSIAWSWIKDHPQRVLAFTQITIAQIALWDFIPAKAAAVLVSVAALFQAWTAFLNSPEKPQ